MMCKLLPLILILLLPVPILPNSDTLQIRNKDVVILAEKINSSIQLDGKLDEPVWKNGGGFEGFIQRDPVEGINPTERTILKLAYDNSALYLGAKMFDSSPDSVMARLARRDEWVIADHITLYLDPYLDKRSGYYFAITAGGTLVDGVFYNDTWNDDSWNGVWEGKATQDENGWTAEMRIPFSQMRFNENGENTWGVNFRRVIGRKNEVDYLVYIPKHESGFVSHFANLSGLNNISGSGKVEVLPYVTTRAEYLQYEDGDPFNSGTKFIPGAGVDFKMGVGSNLNLNATVNPDFGQVEIDPAVINLSDVETFFDEKRPFFIEGSTIFDFGYGGARNYWGFNWGTPEFFYSRRIGRNPQGSIPDSVDYADYPEGTHIIGAAKLTGKIDNSWNVGTIQNITKREYAEVSTDGVKSEKEVEPLAYYGVFRAQNEFDEGQQGLGFISTLAYRDFQDQSLSSEINKDAFSFGLDGWTFLDSSQTWVIAGWAGASRVGGTSEQMINLQQSSRHYFQRPDASHVSVDSSASSLTGYAGRFYLNKQKGNFFVNTAFGFVTPGFDINDVGFLFRADILNWHTGAGYYWSTPTEIYRYLELGGAIFQNHDFDGNLTWEGFYHFGSLQLLNYYSANWSFAYYTETFNNNRTRGGPLTLNPPAYETTLYMYSDDRKDWILSLGGGIFQNDYSNSYWIDFSIEYKPAPNVSLSVAPSYSKEDVYAQYVDTYDDTYAINTFGKRYVFSELDQNTVSASVRLNWTFTPDLSLQLYMQPLISSGDYFNFKELAAPSTFDFNVYGEGNSTYDEENFIADPDGNGPAPPIDIGNPDFDYKSLRGNAVLRWEYLPGSVVYFVWTQTRSQSEETGEFRFGRSFSRMMDIQPENIFMIKMTYWL
ncbi:MAG TPA: DUF5916 domain-containing protein, partial [Ignavibacteriaceae bacterium]